MGCDFFPPTATMYSRNAANVPSASALTLTGMRITPLTPPIIHTVLAVLRLSRRHCPLVCCLCFSCFCLCCAHDTHHGEALVWSQASVHGIVVIVASDTTPLRQQRHCLGLCTTLQREDRVGWSPNSIAIIGSIVSTCSTVPSEVVSPFFPFLVSI